jgi:hypothetical protein
MVSHSLVPRLTDGTPHLVPNFREQEVAVQLEQLPSNRKEILKSDSETGAKTHCLEQQDAEAAGQSKHREHEARASAATGVSSAASAGP